MSEQKEKKRLDILRMIEQHLRGGKAVFIAGDASIDFLDHEASDIKKTLPVDRFQCIPCTEPPLEQIAEVWCDDEGMLNGRKFNAVATGLVGNQVYGGMLVGPILLRPATNDY